MNLYHITSRMAWIDATRRDAYTAPSLASEGFIHCSTAAQVVPVARQFYRGQKDLVLLVIDTRRLTSALRWEPATGGAPPEGLPEATMFPHVYGPIALDAILQTLDLRPDAEGEFTMPPALTGDAAATRARATLTARR